MVVMSLSITALIVAMTTRFIDPLGCREKRRTTTVQMILTHQKSHYGIKLGGQGLLRVNSSWLKTRKVLYKLNV